MTNAQARFIAYTISAPLWLAVSVFGPELNPFATALLLFAAWQAARSAIAMDRADRTREPERNG